MMLTPEERKVLDLLRQVWNAYTKLPAIAPSEPHEFSDAVHRLQDLIASRPAYRQLALEQRVQENKN